MKCCTRCEQWKDESEFNMRDLKRKLLQYVCRDYQQQQMRDRYARNKENVLEINRQSTHRSQMRAADFIRGYLSDKHGIDCGESDIAVLTFDHVTGEKKYNISNMISRGYNVETIKRELEKRRLSASIVI